MNPTTPQRLDRHSGVTMLVTLLVLLVVLIGIGATTRWISRGHQLDRIHRHQVQANWLAESGINRANQMLRADSDFSGDTWEFDKPLRRPGKVSTTVTRRDDGITIEAIAFYPSDAQLPRRARRTWRQSTTNDEVED